jgi:hypothetical protein
MRRGQSFARAFKRAVAVEISTESTVLAEKVN